MPETQPSNILNTKLCSIIHQNIRSLRSNFDIFITELEARNLLPEIIILTEIWISENEKQFYEIPNYISYIKSNEEYRAGGVIVYVKSYIKVINCKPVIFQSADVLELNFNFNSSSFLLLAVYRLQSFSKHLFLNEINQFFAVNDSFRNKNYLIWTGDINCNILENNSIVDEYNTVLASCGLECLLNEPTRVTENTVSCIDHVYARVASKVDAEVDVAVLQANVSDHAMIVINVCVCGDGTLGEGGGVPTAGPPVYRIDYATLSALLDSADWTDVYSDSDPSTAFDTFFNIFQNLILKSRNEVYKINSNIKKLKPWMNNFVCMKVRIKNKIYLKVKKHPNNIKLLKYYKKYSNRLKTKIRDLKDKYYSQLFENCNGNSKAIWKVVNEVTGQNVKKGSEIILNINGHLTSDHTAVSDELNNFFLSVVDKLNIKTSKPVNFNLLDLKKCFDNKCELKSMFLGPILQDDLTSVIKSLKNGISPGIDHITSTLIKTVHIRIIDVLLYLINLSFDKGIFPDRLKEAVVIPLHKSGSKHDCNNF